ncbi:hypothetical protein J8273_7160 [Carpediemonas membranifera]|uniref:Uncharacterized protein n=1 Tax=Carpediemonas membranifera TaxID=201153 RepID=A0A8J6E7N3_9EUKA|nr:hypothetical protein J8273_7160 [Carpediemonas membranifera]|eukprot:KAG9390895.1 hypothetical protein J8273_7160 [Carpediemonas membranifera]
MAGEIGASPVVCVGCSKIAAFESKDGALCTVGNLVVLLKDHYIVAVGNRLLTASFPKNLPRESDKKLTFLEDYDASIVTLAEANAPFADLSLLALGPTSFAVAAVTEAGMLYYFDITDNGSLKHSMRFSASLSIARQHHGILHVAIGTDQTVAATCYLAKTIYWVDPAQRIHKAPLTGFPRGIVGRSGLYYLIIDHTVVGFTASEDRLGPVAKIDIGRQPLTAISSNMTQKPIVSVGSVDREIITVSTTHQSTPTRWKKALKYDPQFIFDSDVHADLVIAVGQDNGVLVGHRSRGLGGQRHGQGFIADCRFSGVWASHGRFVGVTVSGMAYFVEAVERFNGLV